MKNRLFSILLVLCMLFTNVAYLFAGAEYIYGEEGLDYVQAAYFENAPTIDGVVSTAEWGGRTFYLDTYDSATTDSNAPYYNSFAYWKSGSFKDNCINADVWLRWDENYFYVAAKVKDYDGHSLKHSKSETWNGDAIEFAIDPDGPNSITGGDPESYTFWDYESRPWADEFSVPFIAAGYSQIAGGFVECYDMGYYDSGLTKYSKPTYGAVKVAIAPSEKLSDNPLNYSEDTINGYTSYELAIPWKYIYEHREVVEGTADHDPYTLTFSEYDFKKNQSGGIGRELGMSFILFNAAKGEDRWNSLVSWGSGITNVQEYEAPQTCKGSNCVILSDIRVPQYNDYPTGDVSKLEPGIHKGGEYDSVFYDYLGYDTDRSNALDSADKLTTLTYDDPEDMYFWGNPELYQGSIIDVGGEHGNVLNYDRMIETKVDEWDGTVREEGKAPIDQFYIDTAYRDGLYWKYPLSYTFEFDFMYTGTEIVQEGRLSEASFLFGGANAVEYQCGYSFASKQFIISEWGTYNPTPFVSKSYDLLPNTWYNWKFQYDNATCTVRFYVNDEPIFDVTDRYFYYSSNQALSEGTMMIFWMINTQCKFDNVRIYNFYDFYNYEKPRANCVDFKVEGEFDTCGKQLDVTINLDNNPYELWSSVMYLDYNKDALRPIEGSLENGDVWNEEKTFVDISILPEDHKFEWAQNKVYTAFVSSEVDGGVTAEQGTIAKLSFEVLDPKADFGLKYALWGDSFEYTPVESNLLAFVDGELSIVDYIVEYNVNLTATHNEAVIAAIAPTCTEVGYTEGIKCDDCGIILEEPEVIAATGHKSKIVDIKEATCVDKGYTIYGACEYCGVKVEENIVVDALGHDIVYYDYKAPTCTETGHGSYEACTRCEYSTPYAEIAAKGHTEVAVEGVAPTCTENGYTESKKCEICGEVLEAALVIEATGHKEAGGNRKDPTCTEDGFVTEIICSVCNEVLAEAEVLEALGHDEVTVEAKEATCTEWGWNEYVYCTRCDYSTFEIKEAKDHVEVIIPAVDPTETEVGYTEGSCCENCGIIIKAVEKIEPTGKPQLDKFTLYATSEMIDGQLYVYYDISNNPGVWSVTVDINYNPEALVLSQVINGEIFSDTEYIESPIFEDNHRYFAAAEDLENITANGKLVTYVFDVINGSKTFDVQIITDEEMIFDVDYVNKPLTVVNMVAISGSGLHEHTEEVIPGKAPTCTEFGYTDGVKCSECGEVLVKQSIIEAVGHTEVELEDVEATCTDYGYVGGVGCSECGKVIVPQTVISPTGHKEEIIPAVKPTCKEDGMTESSKCSVCGEVLKEAEIIPAGKDVVHYPAKAAGCHTFGMKEYWHCSDCDTYYADAEFTEIVSDPLSLRISPIYELAYVERQEPCHKNGCEAHWVCPECKSVFADSEGTATNMANLVIPATVELAYVEAVESGCHTTGVAEYWFCEVCNNIYADAAGVQHTDMEGLVVAPLFELIYVEAEEPTCHQTGNYEYWYCEGCEAVFADSECKMLTNRKNLTIAALNELSYSPRVEPTTKATGCEEYWFCPVCDAVFADAAGVILTNRLNLTIPMLTEFKVTVNGVEENYEAGAVVTLKAEKLIYDAAENKGYVFVNWIAEGVELEDAAVLETSFVMPANDVVITENRVLHGDVNLDGKITASDVLTLLAGIKSGSVDGVQYDVTLDGKVTAADKLALSKIIKGTYY